ncbi:alginate export family protein [Bythopirellula polymerisocia]|uniref:Alginate export domain-containing protein n=1 Tax=Bythopirellula polymerisocia TaxID=2528003 RepID=A0A5C6CAM2_9BACT|nr:alginate export family protein [Bythopirellula polymerisocia]TWU21763.1 hypothetical protein Pla144_44590 [Bythopirellula polymerisocia]
MSRLFYFLGAIAMLFVTDRASAQSHVESSQYASELFLRHELESDGQPFSTTADDQLVQQTGAYTVACWDCDDSVDCGDTVGNNAAKKPNPCANSHKDLFFNNDFSYLNDPYYQGHCLGDRLKLMTIGEDGRWGTLDIGGQQRLRYHHERGMGQQAGATRFEPTTNDFVLTRTRLYGNWQVNECVRFYTEGIYAADGANSEYIPRPIDRNFGDFLNAFVDLKLLESTTLRVGRQELLYGNQRLISPLDWANTRRTFEGAKVMIKTGDWETDIFYTHYVPVLPNELDRADYDQPFYGCYLSYSGFENFTVQPYYIGYDNNNPPIVGSGGPIAGSGDFSLHTFGIRINGGIDDWLFEMEGGPQLGRQSALGVNQEAGFCTCGIGRSLGSQLPWSPTLWGYYDYASGNAPGGDFNRFNQLFPLAHKYLGFVDAVQRSNIQSPNMLLTMKPTEKINLLFWYYHFMANQADDIVPSIGGTPPQSLTRKDFGDELDVLAKYQWGPRSNIILGWSHLWRGDKILAPTDADFVYSQWELDF